MIFVRAYRVEGVIRLKEGGLKAQGAVTPSGTRKPSTLRPKLHQPWLFGL